jgi:hypothetical protein
MHLDFHNKVAVITGGARGIGAATAEAPGELVPPPQRPSTRSEQKWPFWIWTEMLAKSV